MNNKPKKISEIITENGAQTLLDGYTDFGTDAALTADEQQRILSSAMRKAGFEMKDPMTMKKTRKHSKRFIAFVAAAALMTTAAIGAGAYYMANRGTWNGMRTNFGVFEEAPNELDESKAAALESVTSHKGTLIENTFDGIDVTFEGVVSDIPTEGGTSQSFQIFTLRKADGTAFTKPPEGWHYTLRFAEGSYQKNGYQPLWKNEIYTVRSNDDGSLSVTLMGLTYFTAWAAEEKEYPLRAGFTDIYLEPDYTLIEPDSSSDSEQAAMNVKLDAISRMTVETGNAFADLCNGSSYKTEAGGNGERFYYVWSDDPMKEDTELVKRFNDMSNELNEAHEEIASEVYHGSVVFDIDSAQLAENAIKLEGEYEGKPITVRIIPLEIRVLGQDEKYPFDDKEPTLEIIYKDGSCESLRYSGGGWGGTNREMKWDVSFADNEPIDISAVEAIVFDGVKIEVK